MQSPSVRTSRRGRSQRTRFALLRKANRAHFFCCPCETSGQIHNFFGAIPSDTLKRRRTLFGSTKKRVLAFRTLFGNTKKRCLGFRTLFGCTKKRSLGLRTLFGRIRKRVLAFRTLFGCTKKRCLGFRTEFGSTKT